MQVETKFLLLQRFNHTEASMKQTLLITILSLASTVMGAQENEIVNLRIEARVDYMQEHRHGTKINDASGFKGKYLNIRMDGNIGAGFSYSYRQRLNKPNKDASFFDATDWIHFTYANRNWSFSGGKQVVGIGGYEYDGAPIDLYFCSEYWNNIPCYQIGVSGAYTTTDMKDKFMLQFCESPFRRNIANIQNKEMFAYNLMWYGSHEFYSSIWSVNMIEYLPGKFINYIALGNKFTFGDFNIDLDIMNRAVSAKNLFGRDMSFMFNFQWSPIDCLNFFVKCTHDFNKSGETGDWCVTPGTDITRIGGGIEYYPIKKITDLRIHLNYCYTDGSNGSQTGALLPKQNIIDAGITWKMNVLKIKR